MTKPASEDTRSHATVFNEDAARAWLEGREEEAIELAGKALDIDPTHVFARINLYYFNTARNIREEDVKKRENALGSVLAQTFEDFEVVVVNDGGPPDAEEICKRAQDNRVRYILRNHSGVSSGPLNSGLDTARGEYVAYLDDDDMYKPDHLETLINGMENWGERGVLYTDAERIEGKRTSAGWQWSRPVPYYNENFDRAKLKRQNFISYHCVIHPQGLIKEVGEFNEALHYGNEWEIWIRLSAKYPFKRIPKTTVVVRDQKVIPRMTTAPVAKRQRSRNAILYMHRIFAMSESGISKSARLAKVLGKLFEKKPEIIDILDLRELVTDKPYAMLYKLGKEMGLLGDKTTARRAYLGAVRLAPWEIKSYPKLLSPPKPER